MRVEDAAHKSEEGRPQGHDTGTACHNDFAGTQGAFED